jgi:hypothetical protein
MSIELTPAGKQAYDILGWAYEDLSRVPEARKKVAALWEATEERQARNEISDVATQLSRLADTGRSMSGNITSQP